MNTCSLPDPVFPKIIFPVVMLVSTCGD
jgi:hypothetical protein